MKKAVLSITHDMNNLVGIITNLLELTDKSRLNEDDKVGLDEMMVSAVRMKKLIHKLEGL